MMLSKDLNLRKKEGFCCVKGVSDDEIQIAEAELDLHFNEAYKYYLKLFGVVTYKGHELTGICDIKRLNVVSVTRDERKQNDHVPKEWYVLEQLHIDGLVNWQDIAGNVYMSAPNGNIKKVCDSLEEYFEL